MASLNSLRKRYDRCLSSSDYYGAEQACRMMHHRLTQSKNSSNDDKDEALDILLKAAFTLLDREQAQAGSALALMAVKHCVQYKVAVSERSVLSLQKISESFVTNTSESPEQEVKREKLRFLKAATSWSARDDCAGFKNGHAKLNSLTAKAAADAGEFKAAQRLFIFSDDPEGCAEFLHAWAEEEMLKSEYALLLTKTVIMYIIEENIKDAEIVRSKFALHFGWKSIESNTASNSSSRTPPLANFCEMLVRVCQLSTTAASLYQKICVLYNPELCRDDSIPPMLEKIGMKYFGIQPPPPTGLGGMMNSMLRGMMRT